METLDTCAMRARARTEALRAKCLRLRLQSVHRRRENIELRTACTEVGHACRAMIEQSKVLIQRRTSSTRGPMDLGLAGVIASALAGVGINAFVLEPPGDTALKS
jgi:hypothetical protein